MKRLIISALASAALFVAANAMQRSPSSELSAGTAAMPSFREFHTAAGASKLPSQAFEDVSPIHSTATKR